MLLSGYLPSGRPFCGGSSGTNNGLAAVSRLSVPPCWKRSMKHGIKPALVACASEKPSYSRNNNDKLMKAVMATGLTAAAISLAFLSHGRPAHAATDQFIPPQTIITVVPSSKAAHAAPVASLTAAAVAVPAAAPAAAGVMTTTPQSSSSAAPAPAPAAAAAGIVHAEALRYKVMQVFAMPTYGKLATGLAVLVPLVALGCVMFVFAARDVTWQQALRRMYMLVGGCPGAGCSVDSGQGLAADVVLHVIFWARMCTFCIVLGLITESISSQVHQVRQGNHSVVERNHTVVLNWNKQTMPVLQQMAVAHVESGGRIFRGPVVVLADQDKKDMDGRVAEELPAGSSLKVITRSGNPAVPKDQHKVAAAAADTVVLLWPSGLSPAEASAQQAAVLLALEAAGGVAGQKVVVQTPGDSVAAHYNAAQLAVHLTSDSPHSRQVASLPTSGSERLNQILAQVAHQPQLEQVFTDLLEYETYHTGAELYAVACPDDLAGRSYQHIRRCYDRATLIGFVSGTNHQLQLNPSDSEAVPAGSQLVFVAWSKSEVTPLPEPYQVSPVELNGSSMAVKTSSPVAPDNVTMLCFDAGSAASAVKSMVEFTSKGSTVTVICNSQDVESLKSIKQRGVKVNVVRGDPSSSLVLQSPAARLQEASAVVLCGLDMHAPAAADMQVVASVLQLQSLAASSSQRNTPLAVVASLHSPHTQRVLKQAIVSAQAEQRSRATTVKAVTAPGGATTAAALSRRPPPAVTLHLLQPDELLSGMLTQAACAPELAAVFAELFTQQEGHELYLKRPTHAYGLPLHTPMKWSDLQEVVRARGQTAIGVAAASSSSSAAATVPTSVTGITLATQDGAQGSIKLGLPADSIIDLQDGDKLVVVALNADE